MTGNKKPGLDVLGGQELQRPIYSNSGKSKASIGMDRKDLKKKMQSASDEISSRRHASEKHYAEQESAAAEEYYEDEYYEDDYDATSDRRSVSRKSAGGRGSSKGSKNNGRKKYDKLSIAGNVLLCLQAVLTLLLIVLLLILDILPWWLLTIAIIAVFGLWVLVLFLNLKKKKKKQIIAIVVSAFLCIAIGFGDYYLMLTNNMLNKITAGKGYDMLTFDVVVKADDPAQTLKDAKDYTFGIQSSFQAEELFNVLEEVEKEIGKTPKTTEYKSCTEQAKDLLEGKVQAIIYNDSFNSTIIEQTEDFESRTKVLKQIKVKKKNNDIRSRDVDVTKDPFIVYISGNDEYGELNLQGRSDVNIMVVVNPVTRQCLLVTTPRDYYVQFPGVTGDARDKLTHAGIYGTEVQLDTFKELYGYDIDFYVKVNFSSLIEIIDAIGGVEVHIDFTFESHDHVWFEEGDQVLDGFHALHYARERYAMPNGDADRARHQQDIIEAMIKKLTSAASLTNYTALTDALDDAAVTNMPKGDISAIIRDQLSRRDPWTIIKTQAEGEGMFQPSYAAGNEFLYVCMPYKASISNIKLMIDEVFAGKTVTERTVGETGDHTWVTDKIPYEESDDSGDDTDYTEPEITTEDTESQETSEIISEDTEVTEDTEPLTEESSTDPPTEEPPTEEAPTEGGGEGDGGGEEG